MSDQDFFFDDDEVVEEIVETKPAKAEKAAKKDKNASVAKELAADEEVVEGLVITPAICALIGLIALLLGIIIGIFIGWSLTPTTTPVSNTPSINGGGMGGMSNAPVLSEDELKQQGMPADHPDISGMGDVGGTDTDSLEDAPDASDAEDGAPAPADTE